LSNPNANCLKAKKCPKCGSYGPFNICVKTVVKMSDSGDRGFSELDYGPTSTAGCCTCGYSGIWKSFDDPEVKS